MTHNSIRAALVAAAAGLLLAACGGDDDVAVSTPPPVPGTPGVVETPPTSASQSTAGFLSFIGGLTANNFDQAEPYDLTAFTLPTDNVDTASPVPTVIDQGV